MTRRLLLAGLLLALLAPGSAAAAPTGDLLNLRAVAARVTGHDIG